MTARLRLLLLALLLAPVLALAEATVDTFTFHSPEAEQRAIALSRKLRCPQCQNQNLLESNSPTARDLRLEVYRLVDDGHSDEDVVRLMVERFGDFVRYDPPLDVATVLLWGAPPLALLLAAWLLWSAGRRHRDTADAGIAPAPHSAPATLPRELANLIIGQTEMRRMAHAYADDPALGQALQDELAAQIAHNNQPLPGANAVAQTAPWRGRSARILNTALFMTALLLAAGVYLGTGRLQAAWHWQTNPDPLLQIDPEDLPDAAQQYLEDRLRANPADIDTWSELAQLYLYRDQYDKALLAYNRITELEGKPTAAIQAAKAAVLYYEAGQRITPRAQQLLDEALALDPGEVTALMLLASDHFLGARYDEAIAIWQKLLDEGHPRLNREAVIRAMQTAQQMRGY